jgi:antitoxin FitA
MHTNVYAELMPLVQIRDVPEATVRALRARAAERGMSLAAYLREELSRLSARPTNAEIVERMARRDRRDGPAVEETVAEIRRIREAS